MVYAERARPDRGTLPGSRELLREMRILLSLLLAGLLAACSPASLLNATVPSGGTEVRSGIAFGPGERDRMDVYRPPDAQGAAPLVVFLYGGNWRAGSRDMFPFVALPLAARGAVVAVPDYRLFPEVAFPDFLRDNARAVAWAMAHAAEWGADPRRTVLLGHSAGAYNAAMLALDPRWLTEAGVDRGSLAGMVGLAGPYDFLPITGNTLPVFAQAGAGPSTQPVTYVDGRNPPLLLLAGEDDTTVRPRNTVSLAERVRAAGGPVESRLYPGLGHIGIITAFAPLFSGRAPVLDDVWRFIEALPAAPLHAGG